MKAVLVKNYGISGVIEIRSDISDPQIASDKVIIDNKAASINPFDMKLMSGVYQTMIPVQLPYIFGGDFSGIVRQIGESVEGVTHGEEVYGTASVVSGGSGSMADFVSVSPNHIARKPRNLDFNQAAAMVLVGVSSVQALEEHIRLQPGQKILIHGGAGGIGSIAIQLAKFKGAYVATTVSGDDVNFVKQLGADQIINYKTDKFEEHINNFDAVFDTVGGETVNRSFLVLRKGGVLVSMLGEPDSRLAEKYSVIAIGQNTQTNTTHLDRLREIIEHGSIKPQVDKIYQLDTIQDAIEYTQSGPRGKVVVKIS